MGVPWVPQNGWFTLENPNLKWMMTGATPMTKRKPPYMSSMSDARVRVKHLFCHKWQHVFQEPALFHERMVTKLFAMN